MCRRATVWYARQTCSEDHLATDRMRRPPPRRRKTANAPSRAAATTAREISATGLKKKVALLTRELSEALEQQAATSEVLRVISGSPRELQPVFEAMLASATRLCEATYGTLWLCEGDAFRMVALYGAVPQAYAAELRRREVGRPGRATALARA